MSRRCSFAVALLLATLAVPVRTQVDWSFAAATGPGARERVPLAWHANGGTVLMFGGRGANGAILADTWTWNGTAWTAPALTSSPPARRGHAMTEAQNGTVLLFGGESASATAWNDTWSWSGTWLAHAVAGPPARWGAALAYDAARSEVVLFGGWPGAGMPFGDTWVWNGGGWLARAPAASPTARRRHAMAYDAAHQQVVLFGGFDAAGTVLGDSWLWDGSKWTQASPSTSPPPRMRHAMAYDSARQRVVLFGGQDAVTQFQDTWEWDGTNWQQRAPTTMPSSRHGFGLAHDAPRGRAVLFGGLQGSAVVGDTWTYGPVAPASVTIIGTSCAGSVGLPRLGTSGTSLPWIGTAFTVALTNVPAQPQAPFAFVGNSVSAWRGLPLPFDLAVVNMPGCRLYTNDVLALPMLATSAGATLTLQLPMVPALLGQSFYVQAFAFDPAANLFGLTSSNALAARVGGL